MPRFALEPLLFCLCWVGLAITASVLGSVWSGLAIGLGLLLVFMPVSAFILTRYEDERLERQVRWGILVIAGLLLGIWLRS
jgi:dolichyl-phosphate-mannose--protein O-mannosyl transferase